MTQNGSELHLRIAQHARALLLYTIDPSCPACQRTLPFVRQLAQAEGCDVDVIGVFTGSDGEASEFDSDDDAAFPVLFNASGSAWDVLQLQDPSVLILIGSSGRILDVRSGDLTVTERTAVRGTLGQACSG